MSVGSGSSVASHIAAIGVHEVHSSVHHVVPNYRGGESLQ